MSTDEAIEPEKEVDFEEPPPTDPCPGVVPVRSVRIDPSDGDLEKRLAWLAAEVRTTSAEHAKVRREQTVLERREYKSATVSTNNALPQDTDLPKVTLAIGVDPTRDPTLVGRRISEHHWDVDVSDPEELSRTLPLDTQTAIADPLPFHPSSDKPSAERRSSAQFFLGLFLALFGGILLQHLAQASIRTAFAAIPMAKRVLGQAAIFAELRYEQAETVRLLAPHVANANAQKKEARTSFSVIAPPPAPTSTLFKHVIPRNAVREKSSGSNIAPSTSTTVLLVPMPKDSLGF